MPKYWITWKSFLISFPFDMVAVVFLVAPSDIGLSDFFRWILVGFCAHLSLAPTVFIFSKFRSRIHSRKNEIVGLLLSGAIRGLIIDILVNSLNLYQATSSFIRILNSSITILVFGAVLFFIFDSRSQFEKQFRELFGQALIRQMELNDSKSDGQASPLLASARAKVDEAFKPILESINEILAGKNTVDKFSEISVGIKGMLDKSLRPMSHELWTNQELAPPKFRISGLLKLATYGTKLPTTRMYIAIFPLPLIGATTRFGVVDSVVRNVTSLIFVILVHQLYSFLVDRSWASFRIANICALFIYAFVSGFIPRLLFSDYLTTTNDTAPILVSGVIFALLLIAYNLVELTNSAREQVLDLLRDQVERGNVARYAESFTELQEKIDFASYLHGEVQSELIATSLSLQKASDAGDVDGATQALERAAALLRRDHSSQSHLKRTEPDVKMAAIADSWSGIAEISYNLPSNEAVSVIACSLAVQACEEIVANAVRHGGANKIEINFNVEREFLKVSVVDNGQLNPLSARGLGSSLLDRLTLNWRRENSESGHSVYFEVLNNK